MNRVTRDNRTAKIIPFTINLNIKLLGDTLSILNEREAQVEIILSEISRVELFGLGRLGRFDITAGAGAVRIKERRNDEVSAAFCFNLHRQRTNVILISIRIRIIFAIIAVTIPDPVVTAHTDDLNSALIFFNSRALRNKH